MYTYINPRTNLSSTCLQGTFIPATNGMMSSAMININGTSYPLFQPSTSGSSSTTMNSGTTATTYSPINPTYSYTDGTTGFTIPVTMNGVMSNYYTSGVNINSPTTQTISACKTIPTSSTTMNMVPASMSSTMPTTMTTTVPATMATTSTTSGITPVASPILSTSAVTTPATTTPATTTTTTTISKNTETGLIIALVVLGLIVIIMAGILLFRKSSPVPTTTLVETPVVRAGG